MEYTRITMKDGAEFEVIDSYATIQNKINRTKTELSSLPKFIDVRIDVNLKAFINVSEIYYVIGNS